MKLSPTQIDKIDPVLKAALERARGDEILRGVFVLAHHGSGDPATEESTPKPEDFATRQQYRQGLIDHRRNQLATAQGSVLQELSDLSLQPRGGTVTQTVVVEGPARRIRDALDLPGVQHASLDRTIAAIPARE